MTFKEFMKEVGYNLLTTFWEDFSIADKYGIVGVKDTYRRAFNEWKDDYKFFTELTLVLNHKIWQHYESNRELAALYDRLWREADEYAMMKLQNIFRNWQNSYRCIFVTIMVLLCIRWKMAYITLEEAVCLWQWSICVYQNKNA